MSIEPPGPPSEAGNAGREPRGSDQSRAFTKKLNETGYAFQYAVIERARELLSAHPTTFVFEAAEFPVEHRGRDTRIDAILKRERALFGTAPDVKYHLQYAVVECKRANPRVSNWCFVRAPYVRHREHGSEEFVVEQLNRTGVGQFSASARRLHGLQEAYHHAFEAKELQRKGDSGGSRGAIEEAVTQVLRQVAGLAEFYGVRAASYRRVNVVTLVPVVVTTANLWVTAARLETASLETGNIDLAAFTRVDSVALQYNRSPSLVPTQVGREVKTELSDVMKDEYIRTVHIVTPSGFDSLLVQLSDILDV